MLHQLHSHVQAFILAVADLPCRRARSAVLGHTLQRSPLIGREVDPLAPRYLAAAVSHRSTTPHRFFCLPALSRRLPTPPQPACLRPPVLISPRCSLVRV